MQRITIVAGTDQGPVRRGPNTETWLLAHGATIEEIAGTDLQLITIVAADWAVDIAEVKRNHAITFYDRDGQEESTYLEIQLALDPHMTILIVRRQR